MDVLIEILLETDLLTMKHHLKRLLLERMIWCFTLIIRFARCGMLITQNGVLEEETKEFIKRIHSLSKCEKDTLPPELFIDLLEVEEYFNWIDEKRNT